MATLTMTSPKGTIRSPLALMAARDGWVDKPMGDERKKYKKYSDRGLLAAGGILVVALPPSDAGDGWLVASPRDERNPDIFLRKKLSLLGGGFRPPVMTQRNGLMVGRAGVSRTGVVIKLNDYNWLAWGLQKSSARILANPLLAAVGSAWQLVRVMGQGSVLTAMAENICTLGRAGDDAFAFNIFGQEVFMLIERPIDKTRTIGRLMFFMKRGVADVLFDYVVDVAMEKTARLTRVLVADGNG